MSKERAALFAMTPMFGILAIAFAGIEDSFGLAVSAIGCGFSLFLALTFPEKAP